MKQEILELQTLENDNPELALNKYIELYNAEYSTPYELGEVAYHFALFLHRFGEEEMALDCFRQAYQCEYEKAAILELLQADFWLPNIEAFRESFVENAREYISQEYEWNEIGVVAFPISDEKFMLFDIVLQQFIGWISVEETVLQERTSYSEKGVFSSIKDVTTVQLQDMLREGFQYRNRTVYIMPNELDTKMSYRLLCALCMIPNIRQRCLENVYFVSDAEQLDEMISNYNLYIPHLVALSNDKERIEVEAFLEKKHSERIGNVNEHIQPLLTIGIPTYNRGERALDLVRKLLDMKYDYEIEIVVSNNGSNSGANAYKELSQIVDSRYTYFEFDTNQNYYGNVAQVARLSNGKWLMYLSDEDILNESELDIFLEKLLEYEDRVSMIRVGSTKTYSQIKLEYLKKGIDALTKNAFANNYLSGQVYNRSCLTNELVDKLERNYINNIGYQLYIHLLYDMCMAVKGDCLRHPIMMISEGMEILVESEPNRIAYSYRQYDGRINQWRSYVEFINSWDDFSDEERARVFLLSCMKTAYLISMHKSTYEQEDDWMERKLQLKYEMLDCYLHLRISEKVRRDNWNLVSYNIESAFEEELG